MFASLDKVHTVQTDSQRCEKFHFRPEFIPNGSEMLKVLLDDACVHYCVAVEILECLRDQISTDLAAGVLTKRIT